MAPPPHGSVGPVPTKPVGLPFERLLCIGLDADALQAAVVNKVRSVPNGSFRPLQCATAHGYRCAQCIAAPVRSGSRALRADSVALLSAASAQHSFFVA